MRTELQERADILAFNLQRSTDACFEVLRSISQLYGSLDIVRRKDFQRFVQPALSRYPSIQALEWLPRLLDADRLAFEQAVQAEGFPQFQITEWKADGAVIPADRYPEYFPVTYVEPFANNQLVLGFDLSSDVTRRSALEQARDTGQIVVSGRIELVQEAQHQFGFLVILPIYQQEASCDTVGDRRQHLRGFVLGVFRIGDIVQASLPGLDLNNIDVYFYDKSERVGQSFLAVYESKSKRVLADPEGERSLAKSQDSLLPLETSRRQSRTICTRNFSIADRQWSLLLSPTIAYVDYAELYNQSRITADAATAQAEKLKQAFQDLRQTQARWLLEKKLITLGVGLVLLILGGAGAISYRTLAQLAAEDPNRVESPQGSLFPLARVLAIGTERPTRNNTPDNTPDNAPNPTHDAVRINFLAMSLSVALLLGVYYLLQRQITERQQVEAALWQANDELETQVQERTAELVTAREISDLKLRLFSMVSHEFRTPLSTILISTQMLASSSLQLNEEKKAKNLTRIQAAAKTLAQLLNDILMLNRAEAGKLEFRPEPLEVEPFCQRLIEEIQLNMEAPGRIELICEGENPQADLDSKLLRSILANLLTNAIKYSPAACPVQLTLTCKPAAIAFQIQDQGIGISQEDQQHLFETFYRGQNVGDVAGTGLGLAIAKTCIDLHGGSIHVKSELNQGTTFTVTLPR